MSFHRTCCCNGVSFCTDPSHITVQFNDSWDDGSGGDTALNNYSLSLTRQAGIDYMAWLGQPCYEAQIFSLSEGYIYLINLSNHFVSVRKYMAGFGTGGPTSVYIFSCVLPNDWDGSSTTLTNTNSNGNPGASLTIALASGDIGVRAYEDGGSYNSEFKTVHNTQYDNLQQSVDNGPVQSYTLEILFVADQRINGDWPQSTPPEPWSFFLGYAFSFGGSNLIFYDVFQRHWIRHTDCADDTEWGPVTGWYEILGGDQTGFDISFTGDCEGFNTSTQKSTQLTQVEF